MRAPIAASSEDRAALHGLRLIWAGRSQVVEADRTGRAVARARGSYSEKYRVANTPGGKVSG